MTDADLFELAVANLAAHPDYAYVPYFLAELPVGVTQEDLVNDAYIRARDTVTLVRAWRTEVSGKAGRGFLDAAYADFARRAYTQLPDAQVAESMRALAQDAGVPAYDGENALEVAQAVAAYVRSRAVYTLSPGSQPGSEDFASYFLLVSRKGYCIHFATAATVMLRALGVPARYAEGYVALESDFDAQGRADIPDDRAHAWPEIYLDGVGWFPVEATPGDGVAGGEQAVDGPATVTPPEEETPQPEKPEEPQEPADKPQAGEEGEKAGAEEPERESAAVSWWLWACAGAVLLLAALPVCRRVRCSRRQAAFRQEDCNAAVLAAYGYWEKLRRFGAPEEPELLRLAKKARFSQYRLTGEERDRAVEAAQASARGVRQRLGRWRRLVFRYWAGLD